MEPQDKLRSCVLRHYVFSAVSASDRRKASRGSANQNGAGQGGELIHVIVFRARRVAFIIIGTGPDTQVLGAARRRDAAPLPAVKGMVLTVLLRVDCARRTSASRSCAAAALTCAACGFLAGRY